jgi:hypothetical protein
MSSTENEFTTGSEPLVFEPMADAFAQPEPAQKEYTNDIDGLTEAAKDTTAKREQESPEPIERKYIDYATGEAIPANQTVSLDRAATDLERQRGFEAQAAEQQSKDNLALQVDLDRAGVTQEHLEQAREALQQQPTQAETIQPQPESEVPGVDAEIVEALNKSPKLRQALEKTAAEVQQMQQALGEGYQQYAQATQQTAELATHTMLASFPELQGLNLQQLPAALQVLKANNPVRYGEITQHLARVDQLGKQARAVQEHQQQQSQQQLAQWVQQEDRKFEESIKNESPETVRSVKSNVVRVAQEIYGISENELRALYQSSPLMRSAAFGKMMFDATKYHLAQQSVREHRAAPVPQVQRPGVSQPAASRSDYDVAAAKKAFERSPNDLKLAAAYLSAKRAAMS